MIENFIEADIYLEKSNKFEYKLLNCIILIILLVILFISYKTYNNLLITMFILFVYILLLMGISIVLYDNLELSNIVTNALFTILPIIMILISYHLIN